ncbi:arsenate reductase [Allosphingosinicella indica]|uniref:Arsenate reductase n=2 Tax=Allosphingosinicella indica TaxID=941907 RepID=A0A1X7GTG9_9SPHN|nr:arsenate reductase [Allosphingosinicella indica]
MTVKVERGIRAGMKATIYHNPRCGTSRNALAILEEAGAVVTIVEYLKTPPSRETLARLYAKAGITPRQGLRVKEPAAAALAGAPDDAILDAMAADPILIERPIVKTEKGVVLARPADKVREVL